MKKKILITFCIVFVLLLILIYVLYVFNYIPHQKYSNEDFNIDTYISQVDKDLDGVDDQTDILEGVRNYIAKSLNIKVNIMQLVIQMICMEYVLMWLLLV